MVEYTHNTKYAKYFDTSMNQTVLLLGFPSASKFVKAYLIYR